MSKEDILVWPDGFWVFRSDLPEFNHMSTDYEVVKYGTGVWYAIVEGDFNV